MKPIDLIHIKQCDLGRSVRVSQGQQVSKLGKLIHDDQDAIDVSRLRQPVNKIHVDQLPSLLRHRQRLE